LAKSNYTASNCNHQDEHKSELALFGRRVDPRSTGFDAAETGPPVVCPSGSESFMPNRLKRPSRRPEIAPGCAQHRERLAGTSGLRRAIPLLAALTAGKLELANGFGPPRREPPRKLS
jgi:hypothetical protein